MNNDLMFSSRYESWDTPQDFFDKQNKVYGFTCDVCATDESAKCKEYYTIETDGLSQPWHGVCWMNPPYGREIGKWVKKAYDETRKTGTLVVGLLPARTDTKYFHNWIYKKEGVETDFLKGRLIFGSDKYWQWLWEQEMINGKKNSLYGKVGKKNSAPFPSMLNIFGTL
jgi:site-specific DNA-methyltransferase (adenine-specific)